MDQLSNNIIDTGKQAVSVEFTSRAQPVAQQDKLQLSKKQDGLVESSTQQSALQQNQASVNHDVKIDLSKEVQQVEELLSLVDSSLTFRVDDEAGRTVISIIDGENGSVVRQIPSEEILEVSRKISGQLEEFRSALIYGDSKSQVTGFFTDAVI